MLVHPYRVIVLVGLLVALSACGQTATTSTMRPTAATTAVVPTTDAVTTTEGVTTTSEAATTTSAAADAAPPELHGRWQGEMNGVRFFLSLTGTTYSIIEVGFGGGNGQISVDGNRITFSHSNHGPGEGLYEWLIEGDTLTFTELDPPDDHGRKAALVGVSWTR